MGILHKQSHTLISSFPIRHWLQDFVEETRRANRKTKLSQKSENCFYLMLIASIITRQRDMIRDKGTIGFSGRQTSTVYRCSIEDYAALWPISCNSCTNFSRYQQAYSNLRMPPQRGHDPVGCSSAVCETYIKRFTRWYKNAKSYPVKDFFLLKPYLLKEYSSW